MNADYYPEYKIKNSEYIHVIASELFEIGEKYDSRFVIQINIDNFNAYRLVELICEFQLTEIKHRILEDENYATYHINLSKIRNLFYTNSKRSKLVNILKILDYAKQQGYDAGKRKEN